jgi:putative ABC transport system permease protein
MLTIRLAWRSLWRHRRRTLTTIASIGFGLTVAIFFVGLGEGIYERLIDHVVRLQAGHVTIQHADYAAAPSTDLWIAVPGTLGRDIEALPEVRRTKRLVLANGMAKSSVGAIPVTIMGVEPDVEKDTSPLASGIAEGNYLAPGDGRMAVIGIGLAHRLNVGIGNRIVLVSNDIAGNLVESLFRVKGIFRTGSEEFDSVVAQVPLAAGQALLNMPEEAVHQFGIVLRVASAQGRVLAALRDTRLDERARTLPWQEVMPDLSAVMTMDKGANRVLQSLLILVVMFTIFNTIMMSALERFREFAVRLALGTETLRLRWQLLVESAIMCSIGCALGAALGWVAGSALNSLDLTMSDLYGRSMEISGFTVNTAFRVSLTRPVFFLPVTAVFTLTMLLTLVPMSRAARVSVAGMLRG